MKMTNLERRARIHKRIRKNIKGTDARPRLSVFRSNKGIYAQVIDDLKGHTIAAACSKDAGFKGTKSEIAAAVGSFQCFVEHIAVPPDGDLEPFGECAMAFYRGCVDRFGQLKKRLALTAVFDVQVERARFCGFWHWSFKWE